MKDIEITLPSGKKITAAYGVTAEEILNDEEFKAITHPVIGSMINNELTGLNFKITINCKIKPVTTNTVNGSRIYRNSLCFLLSKNAKKLFNNRRLVISNSLGNNYYFYFDNINDVSKEEVDSLEKAMRNDVKNNLPINLEIVSYEEAITLFSKTASKDAHLLLKHRNDSRIILHACEEYRDLAHTPIVPSTGMLKYFEIKKYSNGFLLRYPDSENCENITPFKDIPVISAIFQEYKKWGEIQNCSSVGELNEYIKSGDVEEVIWVAESLHNKKIAQIADQIALKQGKVKVILIAGPTSSGKTTFAKKLSVELKVVGFNPIPLSLDDYYVNREDTPLDENGEYDFESINAIDIPLFNQNLLDLFKNKEVEIPYYNFMTGKRVYKGHKIKMTDRSVLLIEGIHGLNEKLTDKIQAEAKHKIYISALTQLNLDDHNRIPTTDNRLLRRMIRDYQYRGYSAGDTLSRWHSVRKGEKKNIFPFQENADSIFNSALDYELAVLKPFALPILKTVKPNDENYGEALRLQRFLDNFSIIPVKFVPRTSLLREFIGESRFKY